MSYQIDNELSCIRIEQVNVQDVYNTIAKDFSKTRRTVWDGVKKFLDTQKPYTIGFEAGMGNGKNMLYRDDLVMKGIDTCQGFVDICRDRGLNVENKNILDYVDERFKYDFAISIAVFHHLASDANRFCAMYNFITILKRGGRGLITVWALEQEEGSKKKFIKGDNYVLWQNPKEMQDDTDYKAVKRYYYVYDHSSFKEFINKFTALIVIDSIYNQKGNWFCEFTKK